MSVDEYQPRYVGDTGNPLFITLLDYSNTPYVLTGLTLATAYAFKLINISNGTIITGAGTWSYVNAAQGQIQYAWNAADVAIAGMYRIKVVVTFPSGALTFDQKLIEILP